MMNRFLFLALLGSVAACGDSLGQVPVSPVTSPSRVRSVSGTNPNTSNPYAAQIENTATIGVATLSSGPSLQADRKGTGFNATGWTTTSALDNNAYLSWSMPAVKGHPFSTGNLNLTLFRNQTGPQEYVVRSSLDSFSSNLYQGAIPDAITNISIPIEITDDLGLNTDSPVTFRIYAYGARTNSGLLTVSNIGYVGSTVPVPTGLYDFTAAGNENGAELTWKTQTEAGLSRYEIERSIDGKIYEVIGSLPIRGELVNAYSYKDLKPYRIRNFYRLVAIDMAGKRNISRAVQIKGSPITGLETLMTATPNPLTGSELTVNHPTAQPNALIKITDMAGQEIYASPVIEGTIVTNIRNLNLETGRYYLTLENGDQRYATTLVR
jgi:hypothetical protein